VNGAYCAGYGQENFGLDQAFAAASWLCMAKFDVKQIFSASSETTGGDWLFIETSMLLMAKSTQNVENLHTYAALLALHSMTGWV